MLSLWCAWCALDNAPAAAPWRWRRRACLSLAVAPGVAPIVWFLDTLSFALRRRAGVWW